MTPAQAVAVLLDAVIWHGFELNGDALNLLNDRPDHQAVIIAAQTCNSDPRWEGAHTRLAAVQDATDVDIRALFGLWCDWDRPMSEAVTEALTTLWRAAERHRLTVELQALETALP